jgi:hypothetical protein
MRAGLLEEVRAGGTLPVRPGGSLAGVNLREQSLAIAISSWR